MSGSAEIFSKVVSYMTSTGLTTSLISYTRLRLLNSPLQHQLCWSRVTLGRFQGEVRRNPKGRLRKHLFYHWVYNSNLGDGARPAHPLPLERPCQMYVPPHTPVGSVP